MHGCESADINQVDFESPRRAPRDNICMFVNLLNIPPPPVEDSAHFMCGLWEVWHRAKRYRSKAANRKHGNVKIHRHIVISVLLNQFCILLTTHPVSVGVCDHTPARPANRNTLLLEGLSITAARRCLMVGKNTCHMIDIRNRWVGVRVRF